MPKIKYIYCDSCVFLAYFNAETGRVDILDQLFEEIKNDQVKKIITSSFSVIEVAHLASEKQKGKLAPNIEEKFDTFWANTSLLEMMDFHEYLARKARSLMRQATQIGGYSLQAGDALHLASAQAIGVEEFYTYDKKLLKFDQTFGFKVCEPYVIQPKLL